MENSPTNRLNAKIISIFLLIACLGPVMLAPKSVGQEIQPLTADDVDLEALFRVLSQRQDKNAQELYTMYLKRHIDKNRDFEKFLKQYPQIEQGLLAALNEMLEDMNLCQRIRCANPNAGNIEILNTIFPGLFLTAFETPTQESSQDQESLPTTPLPDTTEQGKPGSIVFLDTSGSMKGYFAPATPLFNFQKFLRTEFRNVLTSQEFTNPFFLCRFGKNLDPLQQVRGFAFSHADFSRPETDIIKVFQSPEFGQRLVSLIITDGIQSDKNAGGGFDIGNLLRAVQQKIAEGYYVYLIGVLAEFSGTVYSEINPERKFPHQGERPIFLWIASHNRQVGSEVAEAMVMRLREALPFESNVEMVRLNDKRLPQISEITVEKGPNYSPQKAREGGIYKIFALEPNRAYPDILIPLKFQVMKPEGGWNIQMKLDPQNTPWAALTNEGYLDDAWQLSLQYKQIPRKETPLTVKVMATFDAEGQWWQEWSTTDDTKEEHAHQTLYLQRLVERTIEPFYTGEHELGTLKLLISKQ